MRILVTGTGGMLGRAVADYCAQRGDSVAAYDHARLDITNAEGVAHCFEQEQPEVAINCAAWTDVDTCESNPQRAYAVNSHAVEHLAAASRRQQALFITISTDYVFDGRRLGFYTQRDDPAPPSVYGQAKLDGERRAMVASARTVVVRTGWLFGTGGRNFLSVIAERARRLAQVKDSNVQADGDAAPLRAITDAYGMPTAATDLARRLRELAARDLPGVYQIVASGKPASFADFAELAFACAGNETAPHVERISAATLRRPAPRPVNSSMRCLLSEAMGLEPLPVWQDALRRFVIAGD